MQVGQVTDAVGLVGTDRAALVPGRVEHEVLHEQLGPALEEIQQADLAVRALEDVVLLDLDGRHLPAPARDLLESAYRLLLSGLQLLARGHPLLGRDDSRTHGTLRSRAGTPQEVGRTSYPELIGGVTDLAQRKSSA
jgi:hypothetical protein